MSTFAKWYLTKPMSVVWLGFIAVLVSNPCQAAGVRQEYVFLIDTSSSMKTGKLLAPLRVAIDDYADTVPIDGSSRVWVFTFDRGIRENFSRIIHKTQDMQDIKVFLASIEAKGGATHIYRSLGDVLNKVSETQSDGQLHNFTIHLFTDGQDNSPRQYTFENNMQHFKRLYRENNKKLGLYYHTLGVKVTPEMRAQIRGTLGVTLVPGIEMPPNADFGFSATLLRDNVPITFVNKTVGKANRWMWDFGDGNTSPDPDPTHVFVKPGDYPVKLTAANPAGGSSATQTVVIQGGAPAARFEIDNPQNQRVGQSVEFRDSSTGQVTSRSWDFGDGSAPSTGVNPSHAYQKAGQYTVTLQLNGAFGESQDSRISKTIYIGHAPTEKVLDFEWRPPLPRMGEAVHFIDRSSGYDSWQWDLGDATAPADRSPSHTYARDGRYAVTLSAKDTSGAQKTITKVVDVRPRAQFALRKPLIIVGETIQVENQSAGQITKWAWDFGDTTKTVMETRLPAFSYAQPGTYTMTLTVEGPFGKDTAQQQIQVEGTDFSFSFTPLSPNDKHTVQFLAETKGSFSQWQWDFGDGNSSSEKNPSHAYELVSGPAGQRQQHSGDYTVLLTALGPNGQQQRASKQIQVLPVAPKAEFQSGTETAVQAEFHLFDHSSGTITRYEWDLGDGGTKSGRNISHAYQQPGTVVVKLTVSNDQGHSDSVTKQVKVTSGGPPELGFQIAEGYTLKGRVPHTVRIKNTSTGVILGHHWDFDDGTTSDAEHPEHTYGKAGTYKIRYWVDSPYGEVHAAQDDAENSVITVVPPAPPWWLYPAVFVGVVVLFHLQPIHRRRISYIVGSKKKTDEFATSRKGLHTHWLKDKTFDNFKVSLKRHWLWLNKYYVFVRIGDGQASAKKRNGKSLDRDRLVRHALVKDGKKTVEFRDLGESKAGLAIIYYLIFTIVTYLLVNLVWTCYLKNLY